MSYGFNGFLGIAKEVTYGTYVAPNSYYVKLLNENLTPTIDRYELYNIVGTVSAPDDKGGIRRSAGNLQFSAHPVNIGYFFTGALQQGSVSVVGSNLWQTDFYSPGTDVNSACPVPSYSMEINRDQANSQIFAGVAFNTLELSVAPNQALRANVGVIAKTSSYAAKGTATFPGSPTDTFTFDTASLSIAGAATADIESWTVKWDNQFEGIPALNNSTNILRIRRRGHQMFTISGIMDFNSQTEYLNFLNQTEQTMKVSLTKAASFQLVVDMPRVAYTAFPLGMPGGQRLTVGFEAKGFVHAGSGTAYKVSLTTTQSYF